MNILRENLQTYLDINIPITREIGIRVERLDERGIMLSAPLVFNKNDKYTAFGGSLAAVIILSGWALTHTLLRKMDLPAHTVVRRTRIDYLKPVQQDICAICDMPETGRVERFKEEFETKGKARWELNARVESQHALAVDFTGVYVALKQEEQGQPQTRLACSALGL